MKDCKLVASAGCCMPMAKTRATSLDTKTCKATRARTCRQQVVMPLAATRTRRRAGFETPRIGARQHRRQLLGPALAGGHGSVRSRAQRPWRWRGVRAPVQNWRCTWPQLPRRLAHGTRKGVGWGAGGGSRAPCNTRPVLQSARASAASSEPNPSNRVREGSAPEEPIRMGLAREACTSATLQCT